MTGDANQDGTKSPVVLCILDGWGLRAERAANAIALATTPNWDRMIQAWPAGQLDCSGEEVGLPPGQMGNSEVGHMNLGAGRVVWQSLPRINNAIADGSMAKSAELGAFIEKLKTTGGTCHLVGLVSNGGVHSHQDHMIALAKIVAASGISVLIHALTDGRDVPPQSAVNFLEAFENDLASVRNARIATVCGRYFAMDRDKRWDRVEKAYNLFVESNGEQFGTPGSAIHANYDRSVTDEFIEPATLEDYAATGMNDGDGLLAANFRADRMREILGALVDPEFDGFKRNKRISFAALLGMVSYSDHLDRFMPAIFPATVLRNTIGEVVEGAGLNQLRLAETEKYPHVTFFFSGGREREFEGEARILIPSPKVATYDLQPEMSAHGVTSALVDAISDRNTDLIIVNYANGDMVGHSGDLDAAIAAVTCLDECLGLVEQAIIDAGGAMLVTADHGNCEMMVDPVTGGPHTAHTLNPVPAVLVNDQRPGASLKNGRLADVAPTLLDLIGLNPPDDMTGTSLIAHDSQ